MNKKTLPKEEKEICSKCGWLIVKLGENGNCKCSIEPLKSKEELCCHSEQKGKCAFAECWGTRKESSSWEERFDKEWYGIKLGTTDAFAEANRNCIKRFISKELQLCREETKEYFEQQEEEKCACKGTLKDKRCKHSARHCIVECEEECKHLRINHSYCMDCEKK